MIVKAGIEEDVDLIGLSCHSWEYLYYLPELMDLLHKKKLDIPVVVGGSVITPPDGKTLIPMGIAAAFGPHAANEEIIERIKALAAKEAEKKSWPKKEGINSFPGVDDCRLNTNGRMESLRSDFF